MSIPNRHYSVCQSCGDLTTSDSFCIPCAKQGVKLQYHRQLDRGDRRRLLCDPVKGPVMVPHVLHICQGCGMNAVEATERSCEECRRKYAYAEFRAIAAKAVSDGERSPVRFYVFLVVAILFTVGVWTDVITRWVGR